MNRMSTGRVPRARSSASRASRRSRQLLIFGEVVLAVPLLVGAAVLVQSLLQLSSQDLGFRREGVLTLRLTTPASGEEAQLFFDEIVEGCARLPQVSHVGAVSSIPLDGHQLHRRPVRLRHRTGHGGRPCLRGNPLGDAGLLPGAGHPVAGGSVPDGGIARRRDRGERRLRSRLWGESDVVGRRMRAPRTDPADEPQWHTVIGVVGDVNERGPEFEGPTAWCFCPRRTAGWNSMGLVLRTQDAGREVAASVRAAVGRIAPQVPITSFAWMEDRLDGRLSGRRFRALLLGGFAALGLALAAIGMFAWCRIRCSAGFTRSAFVWRWGPGPAT